MEEVHVRSGCLARSFYKDEPELQQSIDRSDITEEDKELMKKRFDFIKTLLADEEKKEDLQFYRLKSQDLNNEMRKSIQNSDLLNTIYNQVDFDRVHIFMLVVTVQLYLVIDFVYPTTKEF